MDLAAGAMEPLRVKLGQLVLDEHNLNIRVKKCVTSLAYELKIMHAALRKVGDIPRDQLEDQVRV
jgi:disease resistance protein RPM1